MTTHSVLPGTSRAATTSMPGSMPERDLASEVTLTSSVVSDLQANVCL
jgi:hypothetical protein